eukprot:304095_1
MSAPHISKKRKISSLEPSDGILPSSRHRIALNIGGKLFETTIQTLTITESIFKRMFGGTFRIDTTPFIDRDPTHFNHILNYLRDKKLKLNRNELINIYPQLQMEATYYGVTGLLHLLNSMYITSRILDQKRIMFINDLVTMQKAAISWEKADNATDVYCVLKNTPLNRNMVINIQCE